MTSSRVLHQAKRWLPLVCTGVVAALCGAVPALAAFEDAISRVGGELPSRVGSGEIGDLYVTVMQSFITGIDIAGIVIIARAGFTLTFVHADDQLTKARKTIGYVSTALILINLAPRLRDTFVNYQTTGADIFRGEAYGLLNYFETFVAIGAILFIIISGLRAVTSYGSDDGPSHLKRTIMGVMGGILLISLKFLIAESIVVDHTPNKIFVAVKSALVLILSFGAFIATIVLIIAGLMMIFNLGDDGQYTKAKGIVVRVAIGILVILTSLAIVQLVITV